MGRWISYPAVPGSKPLGSSKDNLSFHLSKVDQVNTRISWGLVVKSKLSPRSGSVAVRQLTPSIKRDHIFFYENAICSWSNLKVYLNDQSEH